MDKLYIVMLAYNEEDNIKNVVNQWYPILQSHDMNGEDRLVIIDDGSKDHTLAILNDLAKTRPLLKPLTKKNGGHGSTVLFGYRYAVANNADFIFQTDSDGQTNPTEFEQFWQNRNQYDAILGNRTNRQDGASRKFVENTLRLILRMIFGVNVPDANAPLRLMRTELVKKYIDKMPVDYALPNVMLTTYFFYFHENIKFLEISFQNRQFMYEYN
jgi:Glycosyltransferases involved in cell wall biogenesis